MATLEANSLRKRYRNKVAVENVSLEVSGGEIIGLLGPNGAGKTTCFYMIVGLLHADGGDIVLDGTSITSKAMHQRAQLGIGYLPQEASVFRKLSAENNLKAILELRKDLRKNEREALLNQLIEEFNLEGVRKSLGERLSGGERRRLEIARSLAMEPTFMLLDEPFAGVDPISVSDIKDEIKGLTSRGIGVLITDHNVRDTLDICDRAYIVHEGHIMAKGTPTEILENKQVQNVYLGEGFSI
tara:strand:+ start:182 stop:907 length:726 start_codon:yes stop_codon:yes gene_type:complete